MILYKWQLLQDVNKQKKKKKKKKKMHVMIFIQKFSGNARDKKGRFMKHLIFTNFIDKT